MEHQGRLVRMNRSRVNYEDDTAILKRRASEYFDHNIGKSFEFLNSPSDDLFVYVGHAVAVSDDADDRSLSWIADHQEQLYRDYPNQWILVYGEAVLAHSHSAQDIEVAAQEYGITNALVTKIVRPTKPERTIYVVG